MTRSISSAAGATPVGCLDVQLSCLQTGAVQATVHLQRPDAAQVLRGLVADEVPIVVPRLYSVCGRAHQVAAQRAIEQARGVRALPAEEAERDARLGTEALQEHLWRLLLDWPKQLGLPPAERVFVAWHRMLGALPRDHAAVRSRVDAFLDEDLLGMPAERWRTLDADGLESWLRGGCGIASALLAALPAEGATLPDDDETGALPRVRDRAALQWAIRRAGWGTFARVLARVVEVVDGLSRIKSGPVTVSGSARLSLAANPFGRGEAYVETARGRLHHRVGLDAAGRIEAYRVNAPTDVNFRAGGPCARALGRLHCATAGAAVEQAGRIVLGFDPCVPWRVSAQLA